MNEFEHTFINNSSDGIIITDQAGKVVFVNDAALNLLGLRKERLMDQLLEDKLVIQSEFGQAASINELAIEPTQKFGHEIVIDQNSSVKYFFARSDRSQFPVSIRALPIRLFDSNPGVSIIFMDLSADEKIERSKSEFVSLVSHQLRTPINIVSWYADKLLSQKRGDLNEKQQEYLREIIISNKRIVDLVSAIVNVSRTDLERLVSKHEEVDLIRVLKDELHTYEQNLIDKKLTLTTDFPDANYTLSDSDREYVGVTIHNILNNAVKYTPEGGQIHVATREVKAGQDLNVNRATKAPKDGFLIAIGDNGLGIPDEQKDSIFTKLFRADNVKALDVTGIGIGLYVARSFIDRLNGHIWFDSKIRQGSTFYVYLPR